MKETGEERKGKVMTEEGDSKRQKQILNKMKKDKRRGWTKIRRDIQRNKKKGERKREKEKDK